MGVPKFFAWLRNRNYSGVITSSVTKSVSSLSLDMNGILHPVKEEVVKKAEAQGWSKEQFMEEYGKALVLHLEKLIAEMQPRDALIMAVDGVAPRAKLKQQRQRRYKNAMLGKSYFDSNALTPGTEAMDFLDKYIQNWIQRKRDALPRILIYSSHLVPGEGEHKIMDIYRDGTLDGLDGIHYIHGADADLIMLSLLSPLRNIYLYREGRGREQTAMINIDLLRSRLEIPFQDFCVALCLFGNDFIPHHPTFSDMFPSIETVIQAVLALREERGIQTSTSYFWDGETLNYEGMQELCQRLAKIEPQMLADYSGTIYKYPSRMMEAAKVGGKFSFPVFRSAWYSNALGPQEDLIPEEIAGELLHLLRPSSARITDMVQKYLYTVEWVMYYYTHGPDRTSCSFIYPYYHAPLFTDVALVLGENQVCSRQEEYVSPLVQLLAVLPLTSKALLPSAAQKLYSDPNLEDAFPVGFVEEMDGINQEHMSTVILPPVPWERLQEAVEKLRLTATEKRLVLGQAETVKLIRSEGEEALLAQQRTISSAYRQQRRYRPPPPPRGIQSYAAPSVFM